ncbi:HD domain-containing protein [Citrifermentans bremense]|uniref:HD domain-containing protein n=1 Tax=Citrifermentans bremense TaxID=60035 RepID=UPI00040B4D51|nr:HD domain-containing protein [Citrifermentans bremense]
MQQIVDFILELDKLKSVTRQSRSKGSDRNENSAEHSWQIAMLAYSLEPYAATPVDIHRVVAMLLVHDIGEIDTGDTIVYATEGWEERKAAELEAVKRIFGIVPEPQRSHFLELWLEFDEAATPEARFAHAADRAMPPLLNLANNGQSWRENGISYERVIDKIGPPIKAGCPAMWEYLRSRLEEENRKGWFK